MDILILGGTGAMGKHLVDCLLSNENNIYVTTRSSRPNGEGVKYITGNAKDDDFITSLLEHRWDVIVDFMIYKTQELEDRVDKLLSSTSQYVFISSARVYANSSQVITEKSPRLLDVCKDGKYLHTDEYALSKARQENILLESKNNNWTIIRPYITYSEDRFQLGVLEKEGWLYRAINGRKIIIGDEILQKFTTLTYGLDVARGISSLLGKESTMGEVFNITSPHAITWKKVLDLYINTLNHRENIKLNITAKSVSDIKQWHSAKYQIDYDRVYNRRFDNNKINQYIDTESFLPPEVGLDMCLNEFLDNPKFRYIDWKVEALKDKQAGNHTSIIEPIGIKNKVKYLLYRYVCNR